MFKTELEWLVGKTKSISKIYCRGEGSFYPPMPGSYYWGVLLELLGKCLLMLFQRSFRIQYYPSKWVLQRRWHVGYRTATKRIRGSTLQGSPFLLTIPLHSHLGICMLGLLWKIQGSSCSQAARFSHTAMVSWRIMGHFGVLVKSLDLEEDCLG